VIGAGCPEEQRDRGAGEFPEQARQQVGPDESGTAGDKETGGHEFLHSRDFFVDAFVIRNIQRDGEGNKNVNLFPPCGNSESIVRTLRI
jgi:hypothetical protein